MSTSTMFAEVDATMRSATVDDVITRMRRDGALSHEIAQLGWGMSHAQHGIAAAVAEAERNGLVTVKSHFRSGKPMARLTEAGWCYPIDAAPTVNELIFQVRRGYGHVETVEQVAYAFDVERRDLFDLVQAAREMGLLTVGRDPRRCSGLLIPTWLGRGFCITHGATTGESETLRGIECRCDKAKLRRTWRPIVAEWRRAQSN